MGYRLKRNQGNAVCVHQYVLEMTTWEYAILTRVDPIHIRDVERGKRASKRLTDAMAIWGMPGVNMLPPGPHRPIRPKFVPMMDIPTDDHLSAWDGLPKTLQEVGDYFGFTKERARQIEEDALERLRSADAFQDVLTRSAEGGAAGAPVREPLFNEWVDSLKQSWE